MNTQLLYNGMSKFYDLLDVIYFKNNDRNPRSALSNYMDINDVKILDICTGTAANAITIAKHNKNSKIVGIDISQEMLHIAKKKIDKNMLNNIKLCKMDATKTTFQDETFDAILISLVLHEIPEELADNILLEAKRILKPEGKILIMEWEKPDSFFQRLVFYPIRKMEPKGFEQFLKKDMKQYLYKFQLEIEEIKHCDYSNVLKIKKILTI